MPNQMPRIVGVEDDTSMRQAIERILQAGGFAAAVFASAELALEAGATAGADCLVLDIHLPGMSGLELRSRLTALGSNLPVIFITAINDDAPRSAAKLLGCVAYLNKPFAPEALVAAVAAALAAAKPT